MKLPKKKLGRNAPEVSVLGRGSARTWNQMYFDDGLALQASYVLDGGFLAGCTPESIARQIFPDKGDIRPAMFAALWRLTEIAKELGATLGQFAIAFAPTHRATGSVLLGCISVEQLEHHDAA